MCNWYVYGMRTLSKVVMPRTYRAIVRGADSWIMVPAPQGGNRGDDAYGGHRFTGPAVDLLDATGLLVPSSEAAERVKTRVEPLMVNGEEILVLSVTVEGWWPFDHTAHWTFTPTQIGGEQVVEVRITSTETGETPVFEENVNGSTAAQLILVVSGHQAATPRDVRHGNRSADYAAATARVLTGGSANAVIAAAEGDLALLRLMSRNPAVPDDACAQAIKALCELPDTERTVHGWLPAVELMDLMVARPSLPPVALSAASQHADPAVRAVAVAHPSCPPMVRKRCEADENEIVAETAKANFGASLM